MGRRVQIKLGDDVVDGEELEFESINESWNEYACSDGTQVRAKLVASKIIRVIGRQAPNGDPLYVLASSTVLAVTPPGAVIDPSK